MHTKLYSYALKTAKQSDLPEKPLGLLQIALLSIHVRKIEVNSGPLLLLRLKHSTTNKQPIRSKRTRSASIPLQNRSLLSPTRPTRSTKRLSRCTAEDPTSQSRCTDSTPNIVPIPNPDSQRIAQFPHAFILVNQVETDQITLRVLLGCERKRGDRHFELLLSLSRAAFSLPAPIEPIRSPPRLPRRAACASTRD